MAFGGFLIQAVLVSLSGVMAPGPLTAVSVGKGSESPHAGARVALGHGIVEFPLMVAIYLGLGRWVQTPTAKAVIGLLGGVALLWMSADMLRTARQPVTVHGRGGTSPVAAGVLMSAGNPYFLVWWATVGAALILQAAAFGLPGFLAFALAHWLCDLGWNEALSYVTYRGGTLLGRRFYRGILFLCGLFLLYLGFTFLRDAVTTLWL